MKLAYLTNVYPAPSHSFIRREILAHEAAGRPVVLETGCCQTVPSGILPRP